MLLQGIKRCILIGTLDSNCDRVLAAGCYAKQCEQLFGAGRLAVDVIGYGYLAVKALCELNERASMAATKGGKA